MQLRGTMSINERGHLEIGGCDVTELAEEYGTPLYILDEALIRERCRAYVAGFRSVYPDFRVIYAGKALLTTAICRIVEQEGLSLDVVSGGELYTALHADFPTERIYFHGNNKSPEEIEAALAARVHRFIVDNFYELELLSALAGEPVDLLLRITPGIEAHTHSYIQTGQEDSKFGFGLQSAPEAVARALEAKSLRLRGFHCHIGSQIFDVASFDAAVEAMFGFLGEMRSRFGFIAEELNLGGGLGIRYVDGDVSMDPKAYAEHLGASVRREAERLGYPLPTLMVEPGRSIVGEAGTTLYTLGSIKEIPGIRTYVSVDGGMADNPRVALYGAKYEAIVANKALAAPEGKVSIAGKCCESGDMLIWDLDAPRIEPGDLLAVFSTGAYNYSMASNYNRLPRPAAVLVYEGRADLIVARESYADLVRNDRIPERLARGVGVSVSEKADSA